MKGAGSRTFKKLASSPKAQAFAKDLIEVCIRHSLSLGVLRDGSLMVEALRPINIDALQREAVVYRTEREHTDDVF